MGGAGDSYVRRGGCEEGGEGERGRGRGGVVFGSG